MGIKLVEEVMDWCPDDVTPAQRWCLTVLARDANDATRETWHGPEHPEILRRVRMSPKRWESVRSELMKRGLIEPVSGGFRGKAVRYRIASMFAPCVVQDCRKTPEARGAFSGYSPVRISKDPRIPGVNEDERPPDSRGQSAERPPESGGPTPPSCSSPPTSSPEAPTEERQQPSQREGGGIASLEEQAAYRTLARITAKDPRLTVGETELHQLAPLAVTWLQRATEQQLELAITAGLPGTIGNPVGFVRKRLIQKLPPPPQPDHVEERCGRDTCNPVTFMVTLPDHSIDFCDICHPTGRARARRQQRTAA